MADVDTVEGGTADTAVDGPRRTRSAPKTAEPAARLGHFQLLELLGRGGMGAVYSAYDLRLDRKVAIKLLRGGERDAPTREHHQQRLLREAQAMGKLSHPNVVPVYEVGVDRDTVFIAMEYVAGQTLAKWLATPRSWRDIIGVFVHAARGLAAAHEVGIVHRDFKPSNVLVDERGRVRVVDFGIAQVSGISEIEHDSQPTPTIDLGDELTPPSSSTPLTEQGSLVGTPAYMSPEQYRSAAVDARSDQFSFSVALYEALYGTRPFPGRGKTLAENVKEGRFERPDSKSVPGWVTAIVLRGMASNPDARFESITALADALEHDPRRLRRRIAAVVVAAGVLATTAALVGARLSADGDRACTGAEDHLAGVWDEATRSALERSFIASNAPYADESLARVVRVLDDYRAAWIAMRTDACRATRDRGDQSEHVLDLRNGCLDHRRAQLRALTTLLAGKLGAKDVEHAVLAASALDPLGECADSRALLQPTVQADPDLLARLEQLNAERRLNRHTRTLPPVRALVADARAKRDARVLARALELQGVLEMNVGELAKAEVTLGEALLRARRLGDLDLFATAAIDLVETLAEAGISKAREALGAIRLVEAIIEDVHDPTLPIRLAMEKGNEHAVLARHDLALPILEHTLERARRVLGDDHVLVFQLQRLQSSALMGLGRQADAAVAQDALIASTTRVLGAHHPATLLARTQRCRIFVDGGDPARADACYIDVLPEAVRVIGASDRELLSMRSFHAGVLRALGKTAAAEQAYAAILADVPVEAWADKWFVAGDVARSLGDLEVARGAFDAGRKHCERGESIIERKHAGPVGATCIGEALLGLGRPEDALAVLEPMAAHVDGVDPARLGASKSQVGMWRFAYAKAAWEVRRQAKHARLLGEKALAEIGDGPKRAVVAAWLAKLP